jgi:putative heme-binding domain-containing protein
VVKAGKPVEFIFENTDLMPHNLAIVQPGAMEEIGLAAEASAQAPDAAARHYVPNSSKVLMKSRLLQPRESEKISWTAPAKPGVYSFVCTYPGHWRRMYGALYVVEDLDAYQENAEAYLAAHPLEIKDALLKDRRPRTEWKLEDLAAAVTEMHHGRNYGTGKQMFTVANCVACHKLEGVGNQIGPDLTKLEVKDFGKPIDILKEILDPSAKINDKFKSWTIELESGKVVTGLIIEENPTQIKLVENPLAKADALVIKVSDIASRTPAKVSLMPKGLLDKMTREEILDLIAYVFAKGNKNDPLFSGGHDHGHGGH